MFFLLFLNKGTVDGGEIHPWPCETILGVGGWVGGWVAGWVAGWVGGWLGWCVSAYLFVPIAFCW